MGELDNYLSSAEEGIVIYLFFFVSSKAQKALKKSLMK